MIRSKSGSSFAWRQLVMLGLVAVPIRAYAQAPPFPGATSSYRAWVAARLPGNPEGLAIDRNGTIYASLWQSGTIVALDGKGGYRTVAVVPSAQLGREGITLGMEFKNDDQLYVTYMWHYTPAEELDPKHAACRNSQDVYTGIYRVDLKTGSVTAFVTKQDGWSVCFPDDIAVDSKGNLYVTDLTLSGIWKITPAGKFALWSADALLQWPPAPYSGFPEGANDLVISNDEAAIYAVTDGNPGIVRIPIRKDGSAGAATLVSRDLTLLDGVEKDELGNLYVSEPYRDEISVFSPDGSQRIVIANADTAPIVNPTSLTYRNGVLCVANSGMGTTAITQPRTVTCLSGFKRPKTKANGK